MAVCILQVCTLDIHGSQEVHSVAFSWDGKRVVSGGGDAVIKIWDVEMGAVVLSLSLSLLHSLSISLSALPSAKEIFSCAFDRTYTWLSDDSVVNVNWIESRG